MLNFYNILEYFLICLFYLYQISCGSYNHYEKKNRDTIKSYNYNTKSSETANNILYQVTNYSYLSKK
jgi:hypothetical protein